jgi:hypothetical protein
VPHDAGDPLLNTWIIWWNRWHVPLSETWWSPPAFAPLRHVLALSEPLVGLSPLTTPLQWLGASPLLTYNIAFLLSFFLSGLGAHLLVLALTGRHGAAFIAGLAFGFAPYRAAQLPHLQILSSYWMPLGLLGLHRAAAAGRWSWLALFAIGWIGQVLTSGYFLLHFSILIALWLVWFGTSCGKSVLCRMVVAWGLAAAVVAPLLWQARAIHERYGLDRPFAEIEQFSADVTSLANPSPDLALWRPLHVPGAERELFPGVTVIVLALIAVLAGHRAGGTQPRLLIRLRWLLVLAGSLPAAAVAWRFATGPLVFPVVGWQVSLSHVHKPITLALAAFAVAAATSSRARRAWQQRSHLAFYLLATIVLWVIAFGPTPRFAGVEVLYQAPYRWLLELPGARSFRVPARAAMVASLTLAVAGGLAVARLGVRRPSWSRVFVGVAAAGILADGWIRPLAVQPPPPLHGLPAATPRDALVLEWPPGEPLEDIAAMYRSMAHGFPVVNGYTGYDPAHYRVLRPALAMGDLDVLDALRTRHPLVVVVHRSRADAAAVRRRLTERTGSTLLGETAGMSFFLLLQLPSGSRQAGAREALPIASVSGNLAFAARHHLFDGDLGTTWHTRAAQGGNEWIVVELAESRSVGALTLSLGRFAEGFPRELVVETSTDRARWSTVWHGRTAALALAAALDDPRAVPLVVPLEGAAGRFLRLRQVGHDDRSGWIVAELSITGPARVPEQ